MTDALFISALILCAVAYVLTFKNEPALAIGFCVFSCTLILLGLWT